MKSIAITSNALGVVAYLSKDGYSFRPWEQGRWEDVMEACDIPSGLPELQEGYFYSLVG